MLRFYRDRTAQILAVCICLVFGIAGPAAAKSALTDTSGILKYVPDDTPYVFATGDALPDDLLDFMEPQIDEVLKAYQVFFREIFRGAMTKNSADMSIEDIQKYSVIVDELANLLSIEGIRNAGIERHAAMVVFGNGLLPVIRFELADPKKIEAVIKRLEKSAGDGMKTGEVDGMTYRYAGDDEAQIIIGVFEGDAVFALAPANVDEDQLKAIVGLTPPATSIAETGRLLKISKEYGFSEYYIGFIDNLRVAAVFLDKPAGMNAVLLESVEYNFEDVSKTCRSEILDVVAIAPRMVVGYGEINMQQMNAKMVIELRDDIAKGMSTLSALVPGLGIDAGGLLSFGMSLNVPALYAFAEARLDAIEADPFECEYFAEIQAGVAAGRAALEQPLPPFVTGLRGFKADIESLGDYELGSDESPDDINASLVVGMEDAEAAYLMGTMMSADLATVDLQPNGVPVPLALPQLQAVAKAAYAAMTENALAIAIGSESRTRVSEVISASSIEPPPIMSVSVDATAYYALIAQSMMEEQDEEGEENPLPEAARIALSDAMKSMGAMYDRVLMDVQFTSRGIEISSSVTLQQ
ncbi:MAG: hypothetical protein IID59_09445 [Proteobacteria bacterium]|nr:hypothetical protein [Pseudomonadota bacterium]